MTRAALALGLSLLGAGCTTVLPLGASPFGFRVTMVGPKPEAVKVQHRDTPLGPVELAALVIGNTIVAVVTFCDGVPSDGAQAREHFAVGVVRTLVQERVEGFSGSGEPNVVIERDGDSVAVVAAYRADAFIGPPPEAKLREWLQRRPPQAGLCGGIAPVPAP